MSESLRGAVAGGIGGGGFMRALLCSRPCRVMSAISAFLMVILSLSVVACAPAATRSAESTTRSKSSAVETTTQASPEPLELVETSYRWVDAGVDFAYVIKNPNQDFGAKEATLRITMFNAAGDETFTDDFTVWPIRPGEVSVGGSQEDPDSKPASVKFELTVSESSWVPAARWLPAGFTSLRVTGLTLRRSKGKPDPYLVGFKSGHSYFTGFVENPNSVGFKQFVVDVLQRDATGKIVAHYDWSSEIESTTKRIKAGGRVAFRIDVPDKLPSGDTYEAYARPWYDDKLPIAK
jgi:hypothetical protein